MHFAAKNGNMYKMEINFSENFLKITGPDKNYRKETPPPNLEKIAHLFVISQLKRDPKEIMKDKNLPTPEIVLQNEIIIEKIIKSAKTGKLEKIVLKGG